MLCRSMTVTHGFGKSCWFDSVITNFLGNFVNVAVKFKGHFARPILASTFSFKFHISLPQLFNFHFTGLIGCHKKSVYWHVIGMGTTPEVHSIFLEGHTFLLRNHRQASLAISPITFLTAQTLLTDLGEFLLFCHISSHKHGITILDLKKNKYYKIFCFNLNEISWAVYSAMYCRNTIIQLGLC